ncbi:hypothetical protein [Catellatospora sichuanensis]|uniref:hypothetical protein n=1 Tax=Catellatospora sichuanensis TaxID=1969805 RepID=UPI0011838BA4|nr:hypothetical protein [Catellatospora sichuanensis]
MGSLFRCDGDLLLRNDLCSSFVLVDEPAEDRFPAYPALRFKIDYGGRQAERGDDFTARF